MCRVILTARDEFRKYDEQHGILKLFNHLETECGGHGNGYALIKDNKIVETRKGQKLSNEEIYARVSKADWDFLVYHTRINSMGGRGDANCHPFVSDDDCLAMNGTEHSMQQLSDALGRTDTECIFKNMIGLGVEQVTHALVNLKSVFVGCAQGRPYVVKAGGTLHKWGKTFHASTFPADVAEVKSLPAGYIWENGKENLQFVKSEHDYSWCGDGSWSRWSGNWPGNRYTKPLLPKKNSDEYSRGFDDGYVEGFDDGFNDACETYGIDTDDDGAITINLSERYNPSSEYSVGFADGRDAGFNEGYEEGYADAHRELGIDLKEDE